uniref:Interleukin 17 receptor E n=1 Tax=Calidris pygmaea TaxID=425635 RepID=A0A8C3K529_9CHAR
MVPGGSLHHLELSGEPQVPSQRRQQRHQAQLPGAPWGEGVSAPAGGGVCVSQSWTVHPSQTPPIPHSPRTGRPGGLLSASRAPARRHLVRMWTPPPFWQVQFDCFPAESGRRVLVSLRTIPDRGLAISRSYRLAAQPPGEAGGGDSMGGCPGGEPWRWLTPPERAIEVQVPEGPALMVRLCHQLALVCEELPRPFHQQVLVLGGHSVSLSYEFLVPCLCIEASYPDHDSPRSKRCPFRDQPALYGPELWSSVHFHDYSASSKDQMAMVLSASCPLHPQATLCWREAADETAPCHDVPNSTASEEEQVSSPGFGVLQSTSPEGCRAVPLGGGRTPTRSPLTQPLFQVWRSDVRFARKQLLCPDISRRHFGLLGLALVLGLVVTMLLLNCRAPGGRPVLLLYSPDSEEHLGLVCALAERLRAGLGCDVRLDLWEAGCVGQTGALPWLYAQRGRVGRQRGTVLLLWSRGSTQLFRRWRVGAASSVPGDAHDIFGAAMACLHGELGAADRGGGWVLAYFSRLCSPRDVPRPLRPLPTYRLPRQLPGLLGALRDLHARWVLAWMGALLGAACLLLLLLLKKEDVKGERCPPGG